MVTTSVRNGSALAGTVRARPPLPARQRRPGYAALAVVLILGCAAMGAYLYSQAGSKVPVVVAVRDIPAGHTIARADLSTVNVAGGVTAIGGGGLLSIVGQTAVVEILPRTLVQRAMLTTAPPLDAGTAQVGVQTKPGQIPAEGLAPGDTVQVLQLPPRSPTASDATGTATVLAATATVYSCAADPSQSGGSLLTLVVPVDTAASIATAGNAGLVALLRISR